MRMDYSENDEYLDSIKSLKEKYADKIQIETGYEVEYLPGEEENLIELKKETNKIVLGQHFVYDENNDLRITHGKENYSDEELIKYAEYIKRAMELNIPDIIAHPDLFMYVRNGFGEIESKATHIICKAAEEYDIPLEINLHDIFKNTYFENKELNNLPIEKQIQKLKNVSYPCKPFWDIASNYNIKVLYGMDIHHKGEILLFNELVQLANEILGDEIISKLNFIKDL